MFFIIGCIKSETTNDSETVKIDVFDANEIEISQFIENIDYVQLDEESNNHFVDTWKTKINDSFIYCYSLLNLEIKIYSKQGKYLRTINPYSAKHLDYPIDLFLNEHLDELWIIDRKGFIARYSFGGERYIGNIDLQYIPVAMCFFNNGTYILYDGNFEKKLSKNIVIGDLYNRDKNLRYFVSKYPEKKKNNSIPATIFTQTERGDGCFTKIPHNDTIYYSNPLKRVIFEPKYVLDFHGKSLTMDDWPTKGFSDKEFADIIKKGEFVYNLHSFHYVADMLFFRIQGRENSYYFIDTESNKIYSFKNLFDGIQPATSSSSIQGIYKNKLIFAFKPDKLIRFYQSLDSEIVKGLFINNIENINPNGGLVLITCSLNKSQLPQ